MSYQRSKCDNNYRGESAAAAIKILTRTTNDERNNIIDLGMGKR